MEYLYIFIILFFVIYTMNCCSQNTETFNGTQVVNAFSDTKCVDDSLPLVNFEESKTFRCLSTDGLNCIDRNSVGIPQEYPCSNAKKNANFYLSVDGLRNIRVNPNLNISKIYNDFENLRVLPLDDPKINKNVKYLTCTGQGLSDTNHWCGKLWDKVKSQCDLPIGKFGEYKNLCKNIPNYIIANENPDKKVVEFDYQQISDDQKKAVEYQKSIRSNRFKTN